MPTIKGHDFHRDAASGALSHTIEDCQKCREDLKAVNAPKAETA